MEFNGFDTSQLIRSNNEGRSTTEKAAQQCVPELHRDNNAADLVVGRANGGVQAKPFSVS